MPLFILVKSRLGSIAYNYVEETKTQRYGFRLDGVLRYHNVDYSGIQNGIDTVVWNPAVDALIPEQYSVENMAEKQKAKRNSKRNSAFPLITIFPCSAW